ncbi:MAG: flagellar hook-basal body complex protein FliE [Brucellaceae bacterium]|nr:flagellar hook-basal body complex protein FliE [Brucellaceae bacterium]
MIGAIEGLAKLTPLGKSVETGAAVVANAAEIGGSFAQLVEEAASKFVGNLETAESMSVEGIRGGAEPRAVADAVMTAEQSLQTAIAIRDKVVSAWLDLSRMQI